MSCGYSSQSQEEKKLIKVFDKHIVGGAKRGRKKVGSKVFNKYKDNTDIKKLDGKICQQMTLKQLRQTAFTKIYIMIHKIVQHGAVKKVLVLEKNHT